jgi:hypothetical protein
MAHASKLITLIRIEGDPGLWRAEFEARMALGLPGLERLVFNTVRPVNVRATDGGPAERWDAVVEGWFKSRVEAEAARAQIDGAGALTAHLLVEERLIQDSGIRPLPAKVMVTFRRRADLTRAQAQAHWEGPHVRIGLIEHKATEFLRLYFQNHVLADSPASRPEHDYDGVPEYWLDEDALGAVGPDSEVMRAIAEDEVRFIDRTSITTLLLQADDLPVRQLTSG